MEGFNIVRCDRNGRTGGGVCLYLKQSVSHKTLLPYCNSTCEVLIVKISEPEVILVMMYRPPNARAYLRGGFRGFKPPPRNFQIFF